MSAETAKNRWLAPLRKTRAEADRLWTQTRNTMLDRVRRVASRLPGSILWTRMVDRWMNPQLEFPFKSPAPPLQVTEVAVGPSRPDPSQTTSPAGAPHKGAEEQEVELNELVDQTVVLMGEAASNLAAMLEDLDQANRKQLKTILECCRYFHEVYDYLTEEEKN